MGVGSIAGISVLPEKWVKPIVNQFILPAYAQTSGTEADPATPEPECLYSQISVLMIPDQDYYM